MQTVVRGRGIASAAMVALMLLSLLPLPALALTDGGPTLAGVDAGSTTPQSPGRSTRLGDIPDVWDTFPGKSPGESFGAQTAGIGDVDNDGHDDFAVLLPARGYCVVFKGGNVIREADVHPLEGTSFILTSQSQVRPAGDLDSDGYDDMVISAPGLYHDGMRAVGALLVFYGSPSGLRERPNQVILGGHEDMRFASDVDTIGDINNDSYPDLLVGADGWNDDTGQVRIYLGGEHGLHLEPSWIWVGEAKGDRFGHAVTGAGYLNGDVWPDFAVGAPFADSGEGRGKVYIFYGEEDRPPTKVGKVLSGRMLKSYYGLSIKLAGDVNNDGFSDLIISAPEETGSVARSGTVELWLGGEHGIAGEDPRWSFEGESDEARFGFTISFLGDVNRDGYDDVAIGAPFHSSQEISQRGKVYVFFGNRNGFQNTPSMEEVGRNPGDRLSKGLAGVGDVDGDGFADMVVGAPGADTGSGVDAGELHLFRGSHITMPPLMGEAFSVVDALDGDLILCELRHYLFQVNVTHRSGEKALDHIDLHLDPEGENVVYRFFVEPQNLVETFDPEDLAEGRYSPPQPCTRFRDTYRIQFDIKFHWSFPTGRPLTIGVVATDGHNLRSTGQWSDVAHLVDRLTFSNEVQAFAEDQGALRSGDWVASSETITFTGATVEYDLSQWEDVPGIPYQPPRDSVRVVVRDDLGGEWTSTVTGNEDFSIDAITPASSRPEMTYTISIETLQRDKVFKTLQFLFNVDGTPVVYSNPDPSSVIASRYYTASIEIEDPLGPGVDFFTVQYRIRFHGADSFTKWAEASVVAGPGGSVVAKTAEEAFPEGNSTILWRASDLVGNGPTTSNLYRIEVDLGNITFSSPQPPSLHWHNTEAVAVGITIENTRGIPIDLANIQYRISTRPGEYTEWFKFHASIPPGSDPSRVTVTTNVRLEEGDDNSIQWKARDRVRPDFFTSSLYRIRVDLSGPSFSDPRPAGDVYVNSRSVKVSVALADELSGVREDSVRYQVLGEGIWRRPDSQSHRGSAIECSALVTLQEGVDNYIRWQASDEVGHSSVPFVQRVRVDLTPPTFSDPSPRPDEVVTKQFVEVTIQVSDGGELGQVSGVDLGTLQYAVSRPSTGGYTPWARPIVYSSGDVVSFYVARVIIEVEDGDGNFVIWRVSDATVPTDLSPRPNEGTSEPMRIVARLTDVPVNRPPEVIITSPVDRTASYGDWIFFNATASYDPELDPISFLWTSDRDGVLGASGSFSQHLSEGTHTITLTVTDTEHGLSEERTFQLRVLPADDGGGPFSQLWEQVALLLIIVFVAITLLLQRFRIR